MMWAYCYIRLLTHPDTLHVLHPESAAMCTVRALVEQRCGWIAEKVRLTNRLTRALKPYCPQVLEWFKDKDTRLFCDVLTRWPTLTRGFGSCITADRIAPQTTRRPTSTRSSDAAQRCSFD